MNPPPAQPVFRYERKFLVERLEPTQVRAIIRFHPLLFYEPYPPRWVNNFYLDTPDLQNYYANLYGAAERQKARLRWYGDLLGQLEQPVLEIKIKQGLVGTKEHYPFPTFILQAGFSQGDFDQISRNGHFPTQIQHLLRDQQIVLMNRYWRRYFQSRDGRFRLTLDHEMTYCRFARLDNTFTHRQADHQHLVVELKYDPEHDPQAGRAASYLPFRLTRNSKYTQGIEKVYF